MTLKVYLKIYIKNHKFILDLQINKEYIINR